MEQGQTKAPAADNKSEEAAANWARYFAEDRATTRQHNSTLNKILK